MRHLSVSFASLAALTAIGMTDSAVAADVAPAAAPAPAADPSMAEIGRSHQDPTRTITYLGVSYEINTNSHDGSDLDRLLIRGAFAWHDLSVAAEVPVNVRDNPGAGDTTDGFGDIKLNGAYGHDFRQDMRGVVGLELTTNTASKDQLGGNAVLLAPYAGISYCRNQETVLVALARYTTDIDREGGIPSTRVVDFRARWLEFWDGDWFTMAEAEPFRDIENDHNGLILNGAVGLEFKRHNTVVIETRKPVDSVTRRALGWQFTLSYIYSL